MPRAGGVWREKDQSQTTLYATTSIETRYGALGSFMERFARKPKLGTSLKGVVRHFKDRVERSQPTTKGCTASLQPGAA
jgi:hypothetical protein